MVRRGQRDISLEKADRPPVCIEKKTDHIVGAFEELFAQTRPAFGQERVFRKARQLAIASVLALGKHTVSGMLITAGRESEDWSSAYRLFERERIDREALFAPAMSAVQQHIESDESVVVMMDDTLIHKRGRKVCGTAWKRDPLGPQFHTNFVWGQRYLQMSAALPELGGDGRAVGIPLDFIHAPSAQKPNKNAPPEAWKSYEAQQNAMKLSTLAAKRLQELPDQMPGKRIICAVDGGYTNQTVFRNIPRDTTLIGRVRKDARLYQAPVENGVHRGRKKYYGEPLPTPEQIRQDNTIPWRQVKAFAAGKQQLFELKAVSGIRWQGTGNHNVQLIVIRPLAYRPKKRAKLLYRDPAYLICSDPDLSLERLLQAYLWRWEIELNFRDEKTVMGVGEAQVRTRPAVETVPALVVASYAFLLLAAAAGSNKVSSLPRPKWYPSKPSDRCSTQQMIALFRTQLWGLAIDTNKTRFVHNNSCDANRVFCSFPLSSAVFHARK